MTIGGLSAFINDLVKSPYAALRCILPRVRHGAGLLRSTLKCASFLRISAPCLWFFL